MAIFRRGANVSREAESKGPAVLHIRFCSLYNKSKEQLGLRIDPWGTPRIEPIGYAYY